MSTVIKLGGTKVAAARRLVADAISDVDLSGIGRSEDDRHTKCRAFLAATSSTARLPEDLWLGVAGEGGQLVAALHAAPLVGVASPLVELHRRGSTTAGSPGWIARLLREVLLVEEIAVLPAERRRGHGAALLGECHRIARARGVKDMQAHAAVEAQKFFRAAGYIVAPRRDAQVPKEYQCDLVTSGARCTRASTVAGCTTTSTSSVKGGPGRGCSLRSLVSLTDPVPSFGRVFGWPGQLEIRGELRDLQTGRGPVAVVLSVRRRRRNRPT